MQCQHCGRPIGGGSATYIGGLPYHYECTRGPGAQTNYVLMPPRAGCQPEHTLTEADVRRIVREELDARAPQVPNEHGHLLTTQALWGMYIEEKDHEPRKVLR